MSADPPSAPMEHGIQQAVVCIHDLMPHTVEAVQGSLEALAALPPEAVTLLVVPGLDWRPEQIHWLRRLQQQGYALAGHGWTHQCRSPNNLHHRLHKLFISRNVAEHLSLSSSEIAALIERCYQWFPDNGLEPPRLYVPPAWAMGRIDRTTLRSLPFDCYEILNGVYDAANNRMHRLPLTGYEADTAWRTLPLRWFNQWNRFQARHRNRPLRLSIHPFDLNYHLQQDLRTDIARVHTTLNYSELLQQHP